MNLNNLEDARDFTLRVLPSAKVTGDFKGKFGPIAFYISTPLKHYAVTFKRSWLGSYSSLYPSEKKTIGQSMNLKLLNQCVIVGADLLIVMGDGKIYQADPIKWLTYAQTHATIRIPREEGSQEASVPAHFLERFNFYPPKIPVSPMPRPKHRHIERFSKLTCRGCVYRGSDYCWHSCSENMWRRKE